MTTTLPITGPHFPIKANFYTPSVQDRIKRILYRLDHGEQLISGALKHEDNFCVLGLFADESGLGFWNEHDCYVIGYEISQSTVLLSILKDYYDLISANAIFKVSDLSKTVYDVLISYDPTVNQRTEICLSEINDLLVENEDPTTNFLLADIIRSGVIFKEFNNDYDHSESNSAS